MRILMTGASGFVGRALTMALEGTGHTVIPLIRQPGVGVFIDPSSERLNLSQSESVDAVIHLAGEPIAGRWTNEKKRRIYSSRVDGTRQLVRALLKGPLPKVFLGASAVGFYGNRGEEELTEESPLGCGFLSEVCQAWEFASQPLEKMGVRVARFRFGLVLDASGGVLARLAPFFRWGLGGRLGSGHQYISWVSLGDVVSVFKSALTEEHYSGAVNLTSPTPVTQAAFARALAHSVGSRAWLHTPAWALRLTLGEMARELLLAGARVTPRQLIRWGYVFQHPTLDRFLEATINR